jgi:hypothetical protein
VLMSESPSKGFGPRPERLQPRRGILVWSRHFSSTQSPTFSIPIQRIVHRITQKKVIGTHAPWVVALVQNP